MKPIQVEIETFRSLAVQLVAALIFPNSRFLECSAWAAGAARLHNAAVSQRHIRTCRPESAGLDEHPTRQTTASEFSIFPSRHRNNSSRRFSCLIFHTYSPTKAGKNIDIASGYPKPFPVADMEFLPDCLATDRNH